jgi:hypothetical protein
MAKTDRKLRLPETLRTEIEAAAIGRGVSMNSEMVHRLERSFSQQDILEPALALAYGEKFARLLLILARVMSGTGRRALFEQREFRDEPDSWMADPYAFDQARWAAETVLEGLCPPGDRGFKPPRGPYITASRPEVLGHDAAAGFLTMLADPELPGGTDNAALLEARAFAVESLEKLGPALTVVVPAPVKREAGKRRGARQ